MMRAADQDLYYPIGPKTREYGMYRQQQSPSPTFGAVIPSLRRSWEDAMQKGMAFISSLRGVREMPPLTEDETLYGLGQAALAIRTLATQLSRNNRAALQGLSINNDRDVISWVIPHGRIDLTQRGDYKVIQFDRSIPDYVHVVTVQKDMAGHPHTFYTLASLNPREKARHTSLDHMQHTWASPFTEEEAKRHLLSIADRIPTVRDVALEAFGIQSERQRRQEAESTSSWFADRFKDLGGIDRFTPIPLVTEKHIKGQPSSYPGYGMAIIDRHTGREIGYAAVSQESVLILARPDQETNFAPVYVFDGRGTNIGKPKERSIKFGLVPASEPFDLTRIQYYEPSKEIIVNGVAVAKNLFATLEDTNHAPSLLKIISEAILLRAIPGLAEQVRRQPTLSTPTQPTLQRTPSIAGVRPEPVDPSLFIPKGSRLRITDPLPEERHRHQPPHDISLLEEHRLQLQSPLQPLSAASLIDDGAKAGLRQRGFYYQEKQAS